MLAALGQVAHFAVGLGSSPLTIIGLVPIFAAGLAFMRYISVDPESHPINVRFVSNFLTSSLETILQSSIFHNTLFLCDLGTSTV